MQIPGQNEQNSIPRDQIDQLNPITLLKKPQQFKKAFEHMINLSSICFKKKQIQRSIKSLMKCLDMLDLNKNSINIGISKFSKVCILYNLAYSYQMLQKLQKCNRFCQRSQQQFQLLLSHQNTKQQYLFITKIYLILKFQNCAILSQLQQHQKALNMCKSTIPLLQKYIKILLDYSQQQSFKINSIQQSKISCISQFNSPHLSSTGITNTKTERVGFYKEVYGFAQQILQSLLTNIQMQTSKMPKCPFYYWQQNPKQNQQQVKKMFIGARKQLEQQSNCKKSILGVNRNKHWIDQFSIGSIMHMSQIKINSFQQKIPIQQFLFKDKLFQVVIYCSLSQFTMATQLRFIQSSKQKPKQEIIKDNNNKIIQQKKSEIIMKKYGCQQRSQLFKISQLHHFKSIEIMAKNIKTMVPFLTHIIKSYQKHYIKDKMLQPIVAIPDQSLRSIDQSRRQYLQSPENHNFGTKININDDKLKNAFNKKSNININKQLILPAQLVDDIKQQQYDDSQQQQKNKQLNQQINQQKLTKYRKQKSIIGIQQQPLKKSQIYGMIDNQQFLLKSINRHKSAGRLKPKKKSIQKTKPSDINNPNSNRQKKKKIVTNLRHFDSQKQLRIKQHSTIQIKFMYKNKK